jgi:hypothetical protein
MKLSETWSALYEMSPLQIETLNTSRLEDRRENRKMVKTVLQNPGKKFIGEYGGVGLWKITRGKETEVYGINDDAVVYFVRWERQEVDFIDTEWNTQVYIWTKPGHAPMRLTDAVFFDHVVDETGTAMSDSEQTEHGKMMWERFVNAAFRNSSKYKVYLVDFAQKKVSRLGSLQDFRDKITHIWGNSKGVHDRRRVAISDFDLTQE